MTKKLTKEIFLNYDPVDNFKILRDEFHKNAENYFNNQVVNSKINKQECIDLENKYIKSMKKVDSFSKLLRKHKGLFFFLIGLGILAVIILIFLLVDYFYLNMISAPDSKWKSLIIGCPVTIIAFITSFALAFGIFYKKMKNYEKILNKERVIAYDIKYKATQATKALNYLLSKSGIKEYLLQETIPNIKLNKYLSDNWLNYFLSNFGGDPVIKKIENYSYRGLYSGSFFGSPFILVKKRGWNWTEKTYTGSKVVAVTKMVRDSNGKMVARVVYETLTASVTKDFPGFTYDTFLLYGNDNAENLGFTHYAQFTNKLNEKELAKFYKKKEKEFKKRSDAAIKNAGSFTTMGNINFEALWHCTDRNDEKEYRMLFTPVAQQKLSKLLLDNEIGYGDDFDFTKAGKVNLIEPAHIEFSQTIFKNKLSCESFLFNKIYEQFMNNYSKFFKSIYFTFAPIMCIPLYMNKEHKLLNIELNDNLSFAELEKFAFYAIYNKGISDWSDTDVITNIISREPQNNKELVAISAQGFKIRSRIEYVPATDSNGKIHMIPVPWDEYISVEKSYNIEILKSKYYEIDVEFLNQNSISDSGQSFWSTFVKIL
ncbi:MAG1210 family protein [Mycoplasmopsis primatum]|uniref:MAG1210 family protein n=1 Tax=Mycoplasmopsis primatum TaxID=55604 RepID=UPI0004962173|nr:hypothetical protein [Mycoplasmopsis primatum]